MCRTSARSRPASRSRPSTPVFDRQRDNRMATIVGSVMTSHVPAIGGAITRGLQEQPYWKPFFDGYEPVHRWLDQVQPDIAVVFYNDHGLNFFLDNMPTFAVGAASQYLNADEGWDLKVAEPFPGDAKLSWHL